MIGNRAIWGKLQVYTFPNLSMFLSLNIMLLATDFGSWKLMTTDINVKGTYWEYKDVLKVDNKLFFY